MSGSFLSLLEQRTAVSRHDRQNTRFVVMREHIITPGDSLTVKKKTERERERKRETERQRDRETERQREREEENREKEKKKERKREREKEKRERERVVPRKRLESVPAKNECSTRFVAMGVFLRENVVKVVTLTKFKNAETKETTF